MGCFYGTPLEMDSTTMDDSPIQPTRQEVISLFDSFVAAVLLPDGCIGATLASLCDALGLTQNSQSRRIRLDEVLSGELVYIAIETNQGIQTRAVLTAWTIPLWLTGIHVTRLAESKRAAILAFKREAADTLYRHFSQTRLISPAVAATKPAATPDYAPRDEWRAFYAAMAQWLDWQVRRSWRHILMKAMRRQVLSVVYDYSRPPAAKR